LIYRFGLRVTMLAAISERETEQRPWLKRSCLIS